LQKQEDLQKKVQRGEVVLQTKRFRDKKGRWHSEKQYCVNKNFKPKGEEPAVVQQEPQQPLEEGELPEEGSSKVDPKQDLVVIEEQEKDTKERKKRLCKHFKKGHCDRGASCLFLHDESLVNVCFWCLWGIERV
jgi:iron uptake system EfeUOB component EfeO/EfeM